MDNFRAWWFSDIHLCFAPFYWCTPRFVWKNIRWKGLFYKDTESLSYVKSKGGYRSIGSEFSGLPHGAKLSCPQQDLIDSGSMVTRGWNLFHWNILCGRKAMLVVFLLNILCTILHYTPISRTSSCVSFSVKDGELWDAQVPFLGNCTDVEYAKISLLETFRWGTQYQALYSRDTQ